MINIIINKNFQNSFPEHLIDKFCQVTLNYCEEASTDVTVVIDTDAFIQNLNKQYRGIDEATDVLSFDIDHIDPETGRRYLGDIVISAQTVERSAKANGISLIEETRLVIVHGLLHLLGYDHSSPDEEQKMWAEQNKIVELIKETSMNQ